MKTLMRFFLTVICLAALSPLAMAFSQTEAKATFAEAVKAYHAVHYADAVKLNESILAQGLSSPAVYYNLGNAQFKLGHLGMAILNYMRAQVLAPRDSDIKANLSFSRSMVANYLPWSSNPLFAPPQQFFSNRELLWVGFGVFALTGAFLLAGLYSGMQRKRLVLGVLSGIALTAYILGAGIAQTVYRSQLGVCVQKADARFEPSGQATVYFKIPEGTEVKVLRVKEGWAKVERSDNKIGWVPLSSVERM